VNRRVLISIILIWILSILSKKIFVYIFDLDFSFMFLVFSGLPFFLVCLIFSFINNKSKANFSIIYLIIFLIPKLGMAYFGLIYTPLIDTSIFHMDFNINFNQAPRFDYNYVIGDATPAQTINNTRRLLQEAVTPGIRNTISYPVYTADNMLYRSALAQTFETYSSIGGGTHPYRGSLLLSQSGELFFTEHLRQCNPRVYTHFITNPDTVPIDRKLIFNIRHG